MLLQVMHACSLVVAVIILISDEWERFNQTLTRCLAKLCSEEHTDWDTHIDTALMGYRASFQSSIKHSPYFMLYQKEMRLPIDNEMLPEFQDSENQSSEDLEATVQVLLSLGKR